MRRHFAFRIAFALFTLPAVLCAAHRLPSAFAQQPRSNSLPAKTYLEGMALDPDGEALYKTFFIEMSIKDRTGAEVYKTNNGFQGDMGGLYRIPLAPGIYDIFVNVGGGNAKHIRPIRFNSVLVQAGKINKLDISTHRGDLLEVVGEPIEPTVSAVVVSEQIAALRKQVSDLKKQIADMKGK